MRSYSFRNISLLFFIAIIYVDFSPVYSQQQIDYGISVPASKVILSASERDEGTYVTAPSILPEADRTIDIQVNYNGFSCPN